MLITKYSIGLDELPDARAIRNRVFIEEQRFIEEFDDTDAIANHVVLYDGDPLLTLFTAQIGAPAGIPVATGRTFPKEGKDTVWIIGRVAVTPEYRMHGVGKTLMEELESVAKSNGATTIEIGAQLHAVGFYGKIGYVAYGDDFMEEHVPHIKMRKFL